VDERELLMAAVDALNRGDMAKLVELVHPEAVFHPIRASITGDYVGHEGIGKFLADNAEAFDRFELAYDEFRLLADGRLFASGTARIRGRGSHAESVATTAGYAAFRDGLVIEWHDYGDRAAAMAALGLT
jgi:ketosteroid isomerase-like protein